ncbi:sulfate adenylyltransferase subunit CysD [Salinicola avicenniae]|uniref:sulfate adenylyltransferase subunit CysD n=1 Tax=Salinicola avicenniae TaxID=2916836 RepID=UPI0020732D17|nr:MULTISPECIES: sulfate adenylyltransferase subunit CysD [unclassified Salinicola]
MSKVVRQLRPHLQQLEAESMQIFREVVAEFSSPAMLFSAGKDAAVMLHLARKAFYPGTPPFPLLHIDTRWDFQEAMVFRRRMSAQVGMELIESVEAEESLASLNPRIPDKACLLEIMLSQATEQVLDRHGFDAAFSGLRRDETNVRSRSPLYAFRDRQHRWCSGNQRPELWNLCNGRLDKGERVQAFPLSNWNELDVWQYIHRESIAVVPLYYAAPRPVVEREGRLFVVDGDNLALATDEVPEARWVRFDRLGCYPQAGVVASRATTLPAIIQEIQQWRSPVGGEYAADSAAATNAGCQKPEGRLR